MTALSGSPIPAMDSISVGFANIDGGGKVIDSHQSSLVATRGAVKAGRMTAVPGLQVQGRAVSDPWMGALFLSSFFASPCFVDLQFPPVMDLSIDGFDRICHGVGRVHRDKGEATSLAGLAVTRHVHVGHIAVLRKHGFQVLFGGIKGQVSYIHSHSRFVVHAQCQCLRPFPTFGSQRATESGSNSPGYSPCLASAKGGNQLARDTTVTAMQYISQMPKLH